ncbi:MAG: hypothetical protein AMXMBFR61_26630 [Fimbriimonadales bacterium]
MTGVGAMRAALATTWVLTLSLGALAQTERVSEMLVGEAGMAMPKLQWQGIVAGSERVRRGGLLLVAGRDYFFNPDLGTIRIEPPLAPGETAEVEYEIARGRSSRQSGRTLVPLEADFLSTGTARLGLVAQMRDDLAGFLGLRGSYRTTGGWRWTSGYYFSERDISAPGSRLLQMGVDGGLLGGTVKASYFSAGDQFAGANAMGVKAGTDVVSADWRARGSRGSAFVKFWEEETTTGAQRSAYGAGFDIMVDPKLSFAASRGVSSDGGRTRTQDRLGLTYTPYQPITFGVDWLGEMGAGGKTRVRFEAADPVASLAASHTANDHGGPGETVVSGQARVSRSLRLEASAVAEGEATAADTKLWWQPVSRIGLAGTYFAGSGTPFAEAAGVEMKWSPLLPLEFTGMGRRRDSPEGGEPIDTLVMRVTSRPIQPLALRAEYADRPEDKMGVPEEVRRRAAGVDLTLGSLMVGGSYAESAPFGGAAERRKLELQSGVFFSRSTSFRLLYAEEGLFADSLTGYRSYGIGFHSARGSFHLSLEGRMKDYYDHGSLMRDRREYEAKASLGIRF